MMEDINLLVAELLATCAVVQHENSGSNVHTAEVKTFHALNRLHGMMEDFLDQQHDLTTIRQVQPTVEKALQEILFGQFSRLCLSPSFYRLIGKIFGMLFNRGDTRNLLAIAGDMQDHLQGKGSGSGLQCKTAVLHCLGELSMTKQGRMLSGHLQGTVAIVTKIVKTVTGNRPPENELRCSAIRALGNAIQGSQTAGKSSHSETAKLLGKAILDKSPAVRIAVAGAVLQLANASNNFSSVSLDSLISIVKVGLDDRMVGVQMECSKSLGMILAMSISLHVPSREPEGKDAGGGGSSLSSSSSASTTSSSGTSGAATKTSKASTLATNITNTLARTAGGASSPSSKLRGFGFPTTFTSRKSEGPSSYSLESALDMLRQGFENFTYDQVAKRSDAQQSQDKERMQHRSHETRMAYVQTAVEVYKCLQPRGEDMTHKMLKVGIGFASGICDDTKKYELSTFEEQRYDDAFRRSAAMYFLGKGLSSLVGESGKIDLARALLNACTWKKDDAGKSASSASASGSTSPRNKFKRRSSRSSSGASATTGNRVEFKYGPLFLSACLGETACLLSALGDASSALNRELDFQSLLPLLEHKDDAVRLEASSMLYVCAITQPGYASRGILPLLQLIGLYQAEVTVALAATSGNFIASSMHISDSEAERTLLSIDGLVLAVCAFVYSSSANGRPKSTSAEVFLQKEYLRLPGETYPQSMRFDYQYTSVPNSSSAIQTGDLKMIPANISIALLGYAKSMISRQHDGAMKPHATALVASRGWALIGALVSLGPSWCRDNLCQLFQAWQAAIDQALPEVTKIIAATNTTQLDRDPNVLCTISCLKASMLALYAFVRCNQILLRDMPSVTRAVVLLLEQVATVLKKGASPKLPIYDLLLQVQGATCQVAMWVPRNELRKFKVGLVDKLQYIASSYYLNAHIDPCTSLFDSPGLLNPENEIINTSVPVVDQGTESCRGLLSRGNWYFELFRKANQRFELVMNAKNLSNDEMVENLFLSMMHLSCNASHSQVAIVEGQVDDMRPGDHQPLEGMVIPPDARSNIWGIDAAISWSAVVLSQISDDRQRDEVIQHYVNILKRHTATAQVIVLRNVLAVVTSFLNSLARANVHITDMKKCPWIGKLKGIFCVALASPLPTIRQASAQGLGILTRLAGSTFGYSVVNTLKKKLDIVDSNVASSPMETQQQSPTSPNGGPDALDSDGSGVSPYFKSGAVLAFALIRREAVAQDGRYVKSHFIYDMCKLTSQPVRTWALHGWQILVDMIGVDVVKFVKPSLALINAHLLAVDGQPDRGGYGSSTACMGTFTCLARLANSLISGLGPELARQDMDAQRFLNVWETLRDFVDFDPLQLECIRMVQQILLFHPGLILEQRQVKDRVIEFLKAHILGLNSGAGNEIRVAALGAYQLFAERDTSESLLSKGTLALLAHEISSQFAPMQDWVIPPGSSLGFSAFILRRSRLPNRARDPLVISGGRGNDNSAKRGDDLLSTDIASGDDFNSGSIVAMSNSWCDLSSMRFAALRFLGELIGLTQRDIAMDGEFERLDKENLENLAIFTDWMRFFRGIMTGSFEQSKHGAEFDDDEDDDEEEGEEEKAPKEELDFHQQLLQFAHKILARSSWESKMLAVEGMLEVLEICQQYRTHTDIVFAQAALKKVGGVESLEDQFICMHLQELLSGACQAANGTVQSAEIPQVAILGYITLIQIVRMFASSKDPHDESQSILKQYEMQLTATLGPGLGPTTSPLIVPYACALAVELLVSNVSTSHRRIITLLLPTELRKEEDDISDDEEDQDKGDDNAYEDYPPFVPVELLLVRLTHLARLWLAATGVNLNDLGTVSSAMPSPTSKKRKPSGIEKAFLQIIQPNNDGNKENLNLIDAWKFVVSDFGILVSPLDEFMRLKEDALQLADTEDHSALFPVYLDSVWVIARALVSFQDIYPKGLPPGGTEVDNVELILFTNIHLASILSDQCPPMVSASIFSAIHLLLANNSKLVFLREALTRLLTIVCNYVSTNSMKRPKANPKEVAEVGYACFCVISTIIKIKKIRNLLLDPEVDTDLGTWNRLVETILVPIQSSLGGSMVINNFVLGNPASAPRTIAHETASRLAQSCLAILPKLLDISPEQCKGQYSLIFLFSVLSVIVLGKQKDHLETAVAVFGKLLQGLGDERESVQVSVCKELFKSINEKLESEETLKNVEYHRLGLLIRVLLKCDGQIGVVFNLLERCLESENIMLQYSALQVIESEPSLLSKLGPKVVKLLLKVEPELGKSDYIVECTIAEKAVKILTSACEIYPNLVQLVLITTLSLAEGKGEKKRPEQVRHVARGCLVQLAQKSADAFKQVVQSLPPQAAQTLQTAIRAHLSSQS